MDALLILLAVPAGLLAVGRIGASAWGVARANRRRTLELRAATGQARPRFTSSGDPAEAIRQADRAAAQATREDYSLTGAILAGLGAMAMFAGRSVAYGPWAVGLYSAGTLAIIAGFGLAIFGAVLRMLARPLLDAQRQNLPLS